MCVYIYIYISGGPLSALTAALTRNFHRAIKKISPIFKHFLVRTHHVTELTNQKLEFRLR